MCFIWCYFSTNSRAIRYTYRDGSIDWSERITLRWFRTLQTISILCSPLIGTWEWFFIARWGMVIWSIYCWEIALVKVWTLGLVFKHCNTVFAHFCYLLPCCFYIFRLQKPISTIHTTLLSPSLRQTSAPIQFTIVLGVLGTHETLCYLIAGLFERDHLHPTPPTDW